MAEPTRARLLLLLKTKGPLTATAIAGRLGVTAVAIHQHLSALHSEGLAAFTKQRGRAGRPAHLWYLTDRAASGFPDCHAQLVVELLQAVRACFGARGLARLAEARTKQLVRDYRGKIPGRTASLEQRVSALARIRTRDGFMAEWGRGCDGAIELVQRHCSIARAARWSALFCKTELALFRAVLGHGVAVERVEHVMRGARRCVYRIHQAPGVPARRAHG